MRVKKQFWFILLNEEEEGGGEVGRTKKEKTPQNASGCNHFTFNTAIDTKYRKERILIQGEVVSEIVSLRSHFKTNQ